MDIFLAGHFCHLPSHQVQTDTTPGSDQSFMMKLVSKIQLMACVSLSELKIYIVGLSGEIV